MRILIAEDDAVLSDGLQRTLRQSSYAVECATTGDEADAKLSSQTYGLVILDLGLPRMDGLEVLRHLRARGSRTPVLILTARDRLEDRVAGLDMGADDYLVKPFQLAELEARVRALIRRGQGGTGSVIELGPLRYDMKGRRVFIRDEPVELSARELGVFEVLVLRIGRVVSKEDLVAHLVDEGDGINSGAIEVYVHRLRKKLEDAQVLIRTVRGLGYLLEKPRAS
ncbi:MAG TPA: response regulator [Candidatus Methylomirabilis sp.]|nr:response regulator [Candidatus Methylomirabilis sp.]